MGIAPAAWEYIYFIEGAGWIKIGRTRDVTTRLRELQTGSAMHLTPLAVVHGDAGLEQRLHSHFAILRYRGEWFRHIAPLSDVLDAMIATDRSDLATIILLDHLRTPSPIKNPENLQNFR
jgi:hypothetical protein